MNKVILMGRLTRDPNISYSSGERQTTVARYTLAVDRRRARNNNDEQSVTVENRQQILFPVWHLTEQQSLRRNTFIREPR